MLLAKRIKKIREYRGFKQSAIAEEMKISQQAYSSLESRSSNARIGTLRRFCRVMKVDLSFLLAYDIPINDETMQQFANITYSQVIEDFNKMKTKMEAYEELLLRSKGR
ncbi:MAG: helix-turn-helix transcriptional regulator [Chitinophagales bacterium]